MPELVDYPLDPGWQQYPKTIREFSASRCVTLAGA
jgi:hypothetical protein